MTHKTKAGMSELLDSSTFYGESAAWLESMYEIYLNDPSQLEATWRQYFDGLPVSRKPSVNGREVKGNGNGATHPNIEVSPREIHDYFVGYAKQKHTRGFESRTGFDHEKKQVQVLQLINAYRFRGHQVADLNPLGGRRESHVDELSLDYHGLSEEDFDLVFETGSLSGAEALPLSEIYQIVQQTYCG